MRAAAKAVTACSRERVSAGGAGASPPGNATRCVVQDAELPSLRATRSTASSDIARKLASFPPTMLKNPGAPSFSWS